MKEPGVTAVLLTIGEPTLERARASVLRQTHPVREIIVVDNVRPFHRAVNHGAARVKTPFFVQVDSDMVLDDDCVENLLSRFEDNVGSVLCHLRDPLYGRVEAIKMYRTACFAGGGLPDSISPDTDFHDRMRQEGWATIYSLRYHDRARRAWHTFGDHLPDYTQFFGYSRHAVDGRRWHYRRNAAALRHHLEKLHASEHPAALISMVGLAHGLFLPGRNDLLDRYKSDADYERISALLSRSPKKGLRPLGPPLLPLPPISVKGTFRRCYQRGIRIAHEGCRRDLEAELARIHSTVHPWSWLMQVGVCQGLFVDRFERHRFEEDWAKMEVFAYYYEPFSVAKRIGGELMRRARAVRARLAARI